jgi:hypothetical protein
MTITSTGTRVVVTNSIGIISTMNSTFSTSLFGGVNSYTRYYISSINPTTPAIAISSTLGGTPITLGTSSGNMQMAASGWDHINAGTTLATSLDTTSVYFIEPRVSFNDPSYSQTVGSFSGTGGLSLGNSWQAIAYGNNYFLALPTSGSIGGASSDGQTWSQITLPSSITTWTSIAYGNFYWIAVGKTAGGVSYAAYSNYNGIGWRLSQLPSSDNWSKIVYGNGVFVAISTNNTNAAYSTNFGRTWTASTLTSNHTFLPTPTGNAQLSTAQKQFGTASLYLDGTANTLVTSASAVDYGFSTNDFTIECWVYRTGNAGVNQMIVDFRTVSSQVVPTLFLSTTYVPTFFVNGSNVIVGAASVPLNTWTHIAVSRASGSTKMFVNGTQSGSTYTDTNMYLEGPIQIGSNFASASLFSGYIDEFRISSSARYTTTFTPAISAFTPDSSTVALLHFDGTNASTTMLSSAIGGNWVGLSYGTGVFMAISSTGQGSWSYDGVTWQATTLPQSTTTLSGITITGGAGTFTCSTSTSQLVVGQTVLVSGANTGSGSISNGTYLISATNGKTSFTLTNLANGAISTSSGSPTQTFTVGVPAYTGVAWGDNRFTAVQSGAGLYSAYSFNGISWNQSLTYISATTVVYGQGVFVAVNNNSTTAYKSENGIYWTTRTLSNGSFGCIGFGYSATTNQGIFPTLRSTGNNSGDVTGIFEGARAQGRASVSSGVITSMTVWEPGSNYSSNPTVTFNDYNSQVVASITARTGNGVLGNPTFVSRGSGYNTTSTQVAITGNGYADTYQTGYTIIINNLSSLPLVGSNITIAGVLNSLTGQQQVFKVTSASAVYGTQAPFIEANVQISPTMTTAQSPGNGAAVSLRQLYSQCRLTNHDFLSIGTGNKTQTNYPTWDETTAKIQNQAVETNQGHVFYTSTDENGNFNVGGLFGVQQATGTVTLSATQFGLVGLQTLSLGGIAVGSSSVVITQFSTDPTFVANSDAIIPTQRAIKSYLTGRLSQGGANTYTGNFVAGTVSVGNPNFIKSTVTNGQAGSSIKMLNKVYLYAKGGANGADGNIAALDFFMRNNTNRSK